MTYQWHPPKTQYRKPAGEQAKYMQPKGLLSGRCLMCGDPAGHALRCAECQVEHEAMKRILDWRKAK